MLEQFFLNTVGLLLDAAPWLLFGLVAAGLLHAWVPTDTLQRWLGGRGAWPMFKAALIGTPLPLCSCGVLPAALGLRRAGASKGATVSFLIATPENGADSIAVSYALLGPFMTVLRPVAAVLMAVFAGLLTERGEARSAAKSPSAGAACCAGACQTPAPPAGGRSGRARTLAGLRYAMSDILDDLAGWLVVGLLLAGAVATWVPANQLAQWGSGLPAMLAMLAIGIPMYICATASTPIAAAMLLAGISPGTVLVFLLAGPATNLGTLGVIRRELGDRVLCAYLLAIGLGSVGLGLLTDVLVGHLGLNVSAELAASEELLPLWLSALSALVLVVFALRPLRRRLLGPVLSG